MTRRSCLAAVIVVGFCLLPRLALVDRHGLWRDEVFSLAIATGHSLEHAAHLADSTKGDFVQTSDPLTPSAYGKYAEHERPAAGIARVVRAVARSDTNAPLYYVLLSIWTQITGTGDIALRSFSVAWALACLPVIAAIARRTGGSSAVLPALILFSASPLSVYYSTEGRMYSLLVFLSAATILMSLKLSQDGVRRWSLALWIVAGAAGLLTHYFFVFVWLAMVMWLLLPGARISTPAVAVAGVLTAAIVAPWYIQIPSTLSQFLISKGWLNQSPHGYAGVWTTIFVPWSALSVEGKWPSEGLAPWEWFNKVCFLVLGAVALRTLSWRLFTDRDRSLLWMWLLAPWLGLIAFDMLRDTYTVAFPRFAVAGIPAAFLLAGLGFAQVPRRLRPLLLAMVLVTWAAGVVTIYQASGRSGERFREVAALVAERAQERDLVLVHSYPSGVVGVARYLNRRLPSGSAPAFAPWVVELEELRIPEDILSLTSNRDRVILIETSGAARRPEVLWLTRNARIESRQWVGYDRVSVFVPMEGMTSFGQETSTVPHIGRDAAALPSKPLIRPLTVG